MVMVDLTLKGAMDPSSIWTVICMLVNGVKLNEAYRIARLENQKFVIVSEV